MKLPASARAHRQHSNEEHHEGRRLGNGGRQLLGGGTQRVPGRAAAGGFAEVGAPDGVIALCVSRSESFAPRYVVGGVHYAVAVEVARYGNGREQIGVVRASEEA